MAAVLITLAQAKAQLRITTPDGDAGDGWLEQQMAYAEAHILSLINAHPSNRAVTATWVDPATVPAEVQQAILAQLGELDRFRGDDARSDTAPREADDDAQRFIVTLIRRWSTPVIG